MYTITNKLVRKFRTRSTVHVIFSIYSIHRIPGGESQTSEECNPSIQSQRCKCVQKFAAQLYIKKFKKAKLQSIHYGDFNNYKY